MTNRDMVKTGNAARARQVPNAPPLPATEDAAAPTTREDPIDSPQPDASGQRDAPGEDKQGLATRR